MAADIDKSFFCWSREEPSEKNDVQDASTSQIHNNDSISFGRFAAESLSWEKRSIFTRDRLREELDKCKAPGLVAQKKAYFEEYYKRIRSLKGSQENEQTEQALEYNGDCSVSSQTGEDLPVLQIDVQEDKETCSGNTFVVGTSRNQETLENYDLNYDIGQKLNPCHEQHLLVSNVDKGCDYPSLSKVPEASFVQVSVKEDYGTCSSISELQSSGRMETSNVVTERVSDSKMCESNHRPHSRIEESNVSVKRSSKLKDPLGKETSKAEKGSSLRTRRDSPNNSVVASHCLYSEIRSSFVTSFASSHGAQRRAITAPERKGCVPTFHSQMPSKPVSASPNRSKGGADVQEPFKEPATSNGIPRTGLSENRKFNTSHVHYKEPAKKNGVNGRGLENRRNNLCSGNEESRRRKCSSMDKQISDKGKVLFTRSKPTMKPTARSVNLPAGDGVLSNFREKNKFSTSKERPNQKEVKKTNISLHKSFAVVDDLKDERKKGNLAPSWNASQLGKKPNQINNSVLDTRKPRRDMPRWR